MQRMSNHGGKRKGAGAPTKPSPRIAVTVRLDPVVAQWLKDQNQSQSRLIESALKAAHSIPGK